MSLVFAWKIATAVMAGPKCHFFQEVVGFTCQNLLNFSLKVIFLPSKLTVFELNHFQKTFWPGFMSKDFTFTKTIFTFCCIPEPASVELVLGCNFWEIIEFDVYWIAFLIWICHKKQCLMQLLIWSHCWNIKIFNFQLTETNFE